MTADARVIIQIDRDAKCTACGGVGEVWEEVQSDAGDVSRVRECADCFGTGRAEEMMERYRRGQAVFYRAVWDAMRTEDEAT